MDTVADFILLGSKITADGDCSHEIKRHLLLGRKVMTNLDSILTYIYGIYKDVYMQDSKRDTDINNRLLDSVGEGKGGMI